MTGLRGEPEWFVIAVAALFGLGVGSFLNVVVYRVPLGLSVSKPRSFCPTCDRQLSWWENVPVASWLALRGKCHTCHEPISARYPLVEGATAAVFALVTWAWHGSLLSGGYCVLGATVIAVSLIELGGPRAPLSVGATGAALGQTLIIGAAMWLDAWSVLVWSLVGLVVATVTLAVLRSRDPDCRDPRGHGRTLLATAGCWLGGLGAVAVAATVAGLVAWILTAFACLVVLWNRRRRPLAMESSGRSWGRWVLAIASVPLVTGLAVAMAVSLAVAR